MKYIIAILVAMALVFGRRPQTLRAANTYDAAIETHEKSIRRSAQAAMTARHLLVTQGTAAEQINICGATDIPLGTVDNIVAIDENVTVLLIGRGSTKKMVASGVIPIGTNVYAAASGKVAATGSVWVGVAMTPAATDNDILEVCDQPAPGPSTATHKVVAAGIHAWAGGTATTDSIAVVGLVATDIVIATLAARAATETLVMVANDAGNDQIDLTLSANGTDTTTKIHYQVLRAV